MRTRSGPARDQAHPLQIVDSFGHGDARSAKQLAQFGFAGKPVTRLQLTRLNAGKKMFEDAAMLWLLSSWSTLGRRTKFACQSSIFLHLRTAEPRTDAL